jgi:signal transduction histidine kinase
MKVKSSKLRNLVFLLFVCINHSVFSQKPAHLIQIINQSSQKLCNNPDSGLVVSQNWLKQATQNNDRKAIILSIIQEAKLYHQKCEFDKTLQKFQQAITAASNFKNKELLLLAHLAKSDYHFNRIQKKTAFENHDLIQTLAKASKHNSAYFNYLGNYNYYTTDSALEYYKMSLSYAKNSTDLENMAIAYINIGKVLITKKSIYLQGQRYLDSAIVICNKNNYLKFKALAQYFYANSYVKESKFDKALALNISTLAIYSKIKDCSMIAEGYNSMANSFVDLGKHIEAFKYYKEAVRFSKQHNNPIYLSVIYQNIGALFNDTDKDSAKIYLQKAIDAAKAIDDQHTLAYATFNLADINANTGFYQKARTGMLETMNIFQKIDETANIGWVLPCIVQLDLKHFEAQKKEITQNQFDENQAMLKKALDLNANGNNYQTLVDIYDSYIRLGKLRRNDALIIDSQRKLLALKDSVFKEQKFKIGIEMAEKLKTAEQKTLISELELKNTKSDSQRNLAIILSITILVFGAVLGIFYAKNTKRKNQLNLIQQQESFRNQVSSDLHDDVGTLLSGLAMQSEMVNITSTDIEQKKALSEISLMSREAMETMRDIVWAIDSRKDKYENLIDRMRAFAEKNLHLKNIKHTFRLM